MRIGTWNLQGHWRSEHEVALKAMDCDVLLLTEVPCHVDAKGMGIHFTELQMTKGIHWAAIASRFEILALPAPHGASAMVETGGLRFCCSVLPWNGCRPWWPFPGKSEEDWTSHAVSAVRAADPHVWGGDWNHTLGGSVGYGSAGGRQSIFAAVEALGLKVVTTESPGRLDSMCSIDHIAIPEGWHVKHTSIFEVGEDISDHDAYVVEAGAVAR